MRHAKLVGAIALLLLPVAGCGQHPTPGGADLQTPYDDANDMLRRGRAVAAAHAVITTQLALHHVLVAVGRAAADMLGGQRTFAALGAPDLTSDPHYTIEPDAGRARVDVVRDGRAVVGLDLTYAGAAVEGGFLFQVTSARGEVEGFGFEGQGMTIRFMQEAAGYRAEIDAQARLAGKADDVRTATARLTLPAGRAADGAVLGTLAIDVPAQAARFDGTVMANALGPITRGGVDVAGKREYDLRLAGEGRIDITPVQPGAPAP